MIVNKTVAKLADTKTMSRRLKTNLKVDDVFWWREPAKVLEYHNLHGMYDFEYGADKKRHSDIYIPPRFIDENDMVIPLWLKNCDGIPNGCIKEMARHFYQVVSVHSERLQEISHKDIVKEGVTKFKTYEQLFHSVVPYSSKTFILTMNNVQMDFEKLWNSTAKAPNRWEDNPMVEVIEYKELHYE